MTHIHRIRPRAPRRCNRTGADAVRAPAGQCRAVADCLLDTNREGRVDSKVDTDLGGDSDGVNGRLYQVTGPWRPA